MDGARAEEGAGAQAEAGRVKHEEEQHVHGEQLTGRDRRITGHGRKVTGQDRRATGQGRKVTGRGQGREDGATVAGAVAPGGYAAARRRLLSGGAPDDRGVPDDRGAPDGGRTREDKNAPDDKGAPDDREAPDVVPGPPRRAALAALTDAWLGSLFTGAADGRAGVGLVAVGGYGRGELSPCSDLDLLLLHDGSAAAGGRAAVARLADRIWYPVWDLGLALDHSVRTPTQARKAAADDLRVHLGLLDARHLAGDRALTARLRAATLADWRNQAPRRLPQLRELCAERAARSGELPYLLEPDLKEARGGLRDTTALRAVAASWLADAPREGLDEARRCLLDVRDALHLATGRATDRLGLHDQEQVAAALGLAGADTLLRRVYEAARTVAYASDVTWREVGRVLRARSGRARLRSVLTGRGLGHGPAAGPRRTPLAEGVVEQDGEAVLARSARPERDPVLPLRAAAAAARAGVPLSPHAVRRLAATAPPLPTPWPAEARDQLVTLLGAGRATVGVWEALEAAGLVRSLLPEWEGVRCRPQRNAVHTWTVDRHLVETAVQASALTRRVHRPDLLLLAALLHDIGKGRPGDHSVSGAVIARGTAARIGLDAADTEVLAGLVRHHLLLIDTATRRDLDDPATVAAVTDAVDSLPALELLHALTEADARATGPAAWSAWRGRLVDDLVHRAAAVLSGRPARECGPTEPTAETAETAEQERLAREAFRTRGPVLRLQTPPGEAERAADEAREAGRAPEPLGVGLLVAVPDQPGVLPAVAGVLALHRLGVRTAGLQVREVPEEPAGAGSETGDGPDRRAFPGAFPGAATGVGAGAARGTGAGAGPEAGAVMPTTVLLLDWRVSAEYGSLPQGNRLRADLVRALDGSLDVAGRLAERDAASPRPRRHAAAPPPRATPVPGTSRRATVIEVRARDAPGLLHRVGRALEQTGVRVRSAHVSTLGADAVDAFYVTDADGAPLPGARAAAVAAAVEAALQT